jgi:hypothetical protein
VLGERAVFDERGILYPGHDASGITRRDLAPTANGGPRAAYSYPDCQGSASRGGKIAGARRSREVEYSRSIATHVDVSRRDVAIFHILEVDGPLGSNVDALAVAGKDQRAL